MQASPRTGKNGAQNRVYLKMEKKRQRWQIIGQRLLCKSFE